MLNIGLVVAFILCWIVVRIIYLNFFHPFSKYPGLRTSSSTNIWNFAAYLSGKGHTTLKSLHDKFGPVVRTGPTSLSFSTLTAYNAIYGVNNSFEKGPFYDIGRDPGTGKKNVFSTQTNSEHRVYHRPVAYGLASTRAQSYESVISNGVQDLVRIVRHKLDEVSTGQSNVGSVEPTVINVASLLHCFVISTMFEIIHGVRVSVEEGDTEEVRALMKFFGTSYWPTLSAAVNSRIGCFLLQGPKFKKDGTPRGFTKLLMRSREAVQAYIEKPEGWQSSFLKYYYTSAKNNEFFTRHDQVFTECANLILAGQGSTTASVVSTLFELGTPAGQEWQLRIRKELMRSLDRASPSLNAVIKETLRLHPPFPSQFPRDVAPGAEEPIPGLGISLPTGTTVACNLFVMGRSKETWGDDADVWQPERWLKPHKLYADKIGADGANSAEDPKSPEEKFVTFGKGPRSCVGREVALNLLSKVVREVLLQWQLVSHGKLEGINYFEMQYETCDLEFRELSV